MSKTLSNGVMGLRFMQNAQRAKQQAQVELEQAKIKDEAEWEVSQEVKDAWGIGSSSSASPSPVTYESSYLPFLFSSATGPSDESETKPKGRRSFNTKGKEVELAKAEPETAPDAGALEPEESPKRLVSISGFKAPLPARANPKLARTTKDKGKTVQELIREGTGKRAPASLSAERPTSALPSTRSSADAPSGFLKPSGVDAPAASRVSKSTRRGAVDGAPSLANKRNRDESDEPGEKKRRKKKSGKASDVRMIA